jgi:transposase
VQELKELQRQGMSIQAISELTGWDRKTIRKYVQAAGVAPEYGPRPAQPSKLDAFKPYLEERLRAGVWNARVLLRERPYVCWCGVRVRRSGRSCMKKLFVDWAEVRGS